MLNRICLAMATVFVACGIGFGVDLEDDFRVLRGLGLKPSSKGAAEFLRELTQNQAKRETIEKLIAQLGDVDFHSREEATQRLLRMPVAPKALLTEAAKSAPDFEIRWRAKSILQRNSSQSSRALLSSLRVLKQDPGAVELSTLLATIAYCQQEHVVRSAYDAIAAAATPSDLETIRNALGDKSENVRIGAAIALAKTAPPDDREDLYVLLKDKNETLAVEVAGLLADKGDRKVLKPLVDLLGAEDARIRSRASGLLQGFTGHLVAFAPYETAEVRRTAQAEWQTWVAKNGDTAKLIFPVPRVFSGRGDLGGNTLVSTGSRGQVMELDANGKQVWSFAIDAWSAEKLPGGNVLIGSYGSNKVIEVNADEKVVWEFTGINAMNAKPLVNGNYLIADFSGNRVVEVNKEKKIVWEVATPENCFDCDRLPNGNTIAGCPNIIVEYGPDKKVLKEWKIVGRLNGFQALPSGNLLIANFGAGKVYEMNREGKELWSFAEGGPCDVFQLPSGKILVSTQSRIIELGADHKTVTPITEASYGSARR